MHKTKRRANDEFTRDELLAIQAELMESLLTVKTKGHISRNRVDLFLTLPSKKLFPEYYVVINRPISIKEIQASIKNGTVKNVAELLELYKVMFDNAKLFNVEESEVHQDAVFLSRHISEWLAERFTFPSSFSISLRKTVKPSASGDLEEGDAEDKDATAPRPRLSLGSGHKIKLKRMSSDTGRLSGPPGLLSASTPTLASPIRPVTLKGAKKRKRFSLNISSSGNDIEKEMTEEGFEGEKEEGEQEELPTTPQTDKLSKKRKLRLSLSSTTQSPSPQSPTSSSLPRIRLSMKVYAATKEDYLQLFSLIPTMSLHELHTHFQSKRFDMTRCLPYRIGDDSGNTKQVDSEGKELQQSKTKVDWSLLHCAAYYQRADLFQSLILFHFLLHRASSKSCSEKEGISPDSTFDPSPDQIGVTLLDGHVDLIYAGNCLHWACFGYDQQPKEQEKKKKEGPDYGKLDIFRLLVGHYQMKRNHKNRFSQNPKDLLPAVPSENAKDKKLLNGLLTVPSSHESSIDKDHSNRIGLRRYLILALESVLSLEDDEKNSIAEMFLQLPDKKDYPSYYDVITRPISLSAIMKKLSINAIGNSPTPPPHSPSSGRKGNSRSSKSDELEQVQDLSYGDLSPDNGSSTYVTADEEHEAEMKMGYETLAQVEKDFHLLIKNAKRFNDPKSKIVHDALLIESYIKSHWLFRRNKDGEKEGSLAEPYIPSAGKQHVKQVMSKDGRFNIPLYAFVLVRSQSEEQDQDFPQRFDPIYEKPAVYNQVHSVYPLPHKTVVLYVQEIWKNHRGTVYLTGQWFVHAFSTFHTPTMKFYPNEVFKMKTPQHDHALEDVVGPCLVMHVADFRRGIYAKYLEKEALGTGVGEEEKRKRIYICEYNYSDLTKSMSRIKDWRKSFGGNLDVNYPIPGAPTDENQASTLTNEEITARKGLIAWDPPLKGFLRNVRSVFAAKEAAKLAKTDASSNVTSASVDVSMEDVRNGKTPKRSDMDAFPVPAQRAYPLSLAPTFASPSALEGFSAPGRAIGDLKPGSSLFSSPPSTHPYRFPRAPVHLPIFSSTSIAPTLSSPYRPFGDTSRFFAPPSKSSMSATPPGAPVAHGIPNIRIHPAEPAVEETGYLLAIGMESNDGLFRFKWPVSEDGSSKIILNHSFTLPFPVSLLTLTFSLTSQVISESHDTHGETTSSAEDSDSYAGGIIKTRHQQHLINTGQIVPWDQVTKPLPYIFHNYGRIDVVPYKGGAFPEGDPWQCAIRLNQGMNLIQLYTILPAAQTSSSVPPPPVTGSPLKSRPIPQSVDLQQQTRLVQRIFINRQVP